MKFLLLFLEVRELFLYVDNACFIPVFWPVSLFTEKRFPLYLQGVYLFVDRVDLGRFAGGPNLESRCRFIDQVDGLIGQFPVWQVPCRHVDCCH